jgi:hypothetical protein
MAKLTETGLAGGVWTGRLEGAAPAPGDSPALEVLRDGRAETGLSLSKGKKDGVWEVRFPVPAEALGSGAVVFLFQLGGEVLASLPILAGPRAEDDLRTEVALLRAELDLVKRVLRAQARAAQD